MNETMMAATATATATEASDAVRLGETGSGRWSVPVGGTTGVW